MRLYTFALAILIIVLVPLALASQDILYPIDLQSTVVSNGTNSEDPIGYAFDNYGPYTAYERIWVFYSDGQNAVWRTRPIFDQTADWTEHGTIFPINNTPHFNMSFDGQYFHFIRSVDGDLLYRRGKALPNGSISFDDEVVAYSHPTWKLRTVTYNDVPIPPRHFAIHVDSNQHPWIIVKVGDGNEQTSNFKPIALSSTATDGTWVSRSGFPVDLAAHHPLWPNGRSPNVIELSAGKILFTWGNYRYQTHDPERGFRARVWDNGTLGPIENTGLTWHTASSSVVVQENGVAFLNSATEVSRRNLDGSWVRVDPGGMVNSSWNSLTIEGNVVRIWDFVGKDLRYKETADGGQSWGPITVKWSASENIFTMTGSHARRSQGNHHSVLWSAGESPYDIYMGIQGVIPFPSPPLLVSPSNGATDLPGDITLEWATAALAFTYDIQVSTQSDFSTLVVNVTGVTDTSYAVAGLDLNVTHYWRVRSVTEGGTASDWSQVWEFSTVGIPPAPVLTTPTNGAVDLPTSVQFVWGSSPGAENYTLQLATVSDFSVLFYSNENITSTNHTVNGLDNDRTYYWRVRAANQFGAGDWSEVWGFTTQIAVPEIPVLVSPEHNAINQPVTLTFAWQESDRALTYRLQVSKVSNFSSTVVNVGNLTSTSYEVANLEYSQTYYWRVNASNSSGTSGWSTVRSFTTIIERPAKPQLASPGNGATGVSTRPNFDWNDAARADSYEFQLALDVDFTEIVLDEEGLVHSSFSVVDEIAEFTPHYWRVRASNIGGTSDWSDVWQFTTGQAFPVAPTLVSPQDGSLNTETSLSLLWNSVPTATSYQIQLSKDTGFSTVVVDSNVGGNTFFLATGLEYDTQYFWRVRGISSVGEGYWSNVWSFTTKIDVPAIPVLSSPEHGATNRPRTLTLSWDATARAEKYHVQVSTNSAFSTLVYNNSEIAGTEVQVSDLEYLTTYYWRVRATNSTGAGEWSTVWSFTTIIQEPAVPVLVSPTDGAVQIAVDTILVWEASARAESYHLQVSTDDGFTALIADSSGITDPAFSISGLESLTTYYWRVRASNAGGNSGWSVVWKFTTYDVTSLRQLAGGIPRDFSLEQNYPNPFNPTTVIQFGLPSEAVVHLEIYNLLGQRIATLISGEQYAAGTYEIVWDARDDAGNMVSSGVYIYRISAGEYVQTKKMLFMK